VVDTIIPPYANPPSTQLQPTFFLYYTIANGKQRSSYITHNIYTFMAAISTITSTVSKIIGVSIVYLGNWKYFILIDFIDILKAFYLILNPFYKIRVIVIFLQLISQLLWRADTP